MLHTLDTIRGAIISHLVQGKVLQLSLVGIEITSNPSSSDEKGKYGVANDKEKLVAHDDMSALLAVQRRKLKDGNGEYDDCQCSGFCPRQSH